MAALRMDLNLGIISEVEKKLKKKLLIEYMYSNLKHHNFWAYRYFFCELLSLINVCGKFYVPYPKEKIMCQSSLLDSANSISFQPFVYYTFLLINIMLFSIELDIQEYMTCHVRYQKENDTYIMLFSFG